MQQSKHMDFNSNLQNNIALTQMSSNLFKPDQMHTQNIPYDP
jgi:hypothetical protein